MITWSCTGMSSSRPAATSCSVTARSSGDGHRIAARMIVHEDDRRGALGDRLAKHLARMHERRIQNAARDRYVPFQPMLRIQYRHVKLLDRQIFQPRREHRDHVPGRPHRRPVRSRLGDHPAPEFERRVDRHGAHQLLPHRPREEPLRAAWPCVAATHPPRPARPRRAAAPTGLPHRTRARWPVIQAKRAHALPARSTAPGDAPTAATHE